MERRPSTCAVNVKHLYFECKNNVVFFVTHVLIFKIMSKRWLRFIDLVSTGCDVCQLQMQIKTTRLVLFVSWRGRGCRSESITWKHYSGPTQEELGKKKIKLKWTQVDNLARLVVTWGFVSGVGRQGEDDDGMFVGASLLWLSSYSTQQWHLVDCCNNRLHSSPEIYNANTVRKFVSCKSVFQELVHAI